MKTTRKMSVLGGALICRPPWDSGFRAGKTYRITFDGETVEIKGPALSEKKYIHETVVYGKRTVDRTVFEGTKKGPTLRLFMGMQAGLYEIDYTPGERIMKIRLANIQN